MDMELRALEEKLDQLVGLCQHLRADNKQLRQQLAQAMNDNKQLADKMLGARTRLETLLTQIPDNDQ